MGSITYKHHIPYLFPSLLVCCAKLPSTVSPLLLVQNYVVAVQIVVQVVGHVQARRLVHVILLFFGHDFDGTAKSRKTSCVWVGCANPLLTAHGGGAKAVEAGEACFSAELRSRSFPRSGHRPRVSALGGIPGIPGTPDV